MKTRTTGRMAALARGIHQHLLALIVASYALAAVAPGPGLWIKGAKLVDATTPLGHLEIPLTKVLLALLLFNAGVRVRLGEVGAMARRPGPILLGLAANLLVPLAFLAGMVPLLGLWHNPDEAAIVLVGLALVSAMPIAGSSTGWAQAADGDMALSLGLVLGSTLISPLTTPASLHLLGAIAPGRWGAELHRLAAGGTGSFLLAWVLAPAVLGVVVRWALGEGRAPALEARLKLLAPLTLVALCYGNASDCLPETVRNPDWDFLGIIAVYVTGLCGLAFASGAVLGRVLGVGRSQQISLMFGLGMNNNGTGLVLAGLALGSGPRALLPVLVYNLTQHVVAGAVRSLIRADTHDDHPAPPARPHAAATRVGQPATP